MSVSFACFLKIITKKYIKTANFILEITSSLRFFVDYMRGKPFTCSSKIPREGGKLDFEHFRFR